MGDSRLIDIWQEVMSLSSSGSIALAVILSVAILALLAILTYCFLKKRRECSHRPVATGPAHVALSEQDTLVYNTTTKPVWCHQLTSVTSSPLSPWRPKTCARFIYFTCFQCETVCGKISPLPFKCKVDDYYQSVSIVEGSHMCIDSVYWL